MELRLARCDAAQRVGHCTCQEGCFEIRVVCVLRGKSHHVWTPKCPPGPVFWICVVACKVHPCTACTACSGNHLITEGHCDIPENHSRVVFTITICRASILVYKLTADTKEKQCSKHDTGNNGHNKMEGRCTVYVGDRASRCKEAIMAVCILTTNAPC